MPENEGKENRVDVDEQDISLKLGVFIRLSTESLG